MKKRKHHKRAEAVPEKDAYTVEEFCARHGLSRATYYNLESKPRLMRVSKRWFISKEAAREWRAAREQNGEPVTDAPQNPASPPA